MTKVEILLMTLSPWISYLIGEGMELSGIVSILCNGIFLSHYAAPNLNDGSRKFMIHLYEAAAHLCETLVFLFLGIALAAFNHPY